MFKLTSGYDVNWRPDANIIPDGKNEHSPSSNIKYCKPKNVVIILAPKLIIQQHNSVRDSLDFSIADEAGKTSDEYIKEGEKLRHLVEGFITKNTSIKPISKLNISKKRNLLPALLYSFSVLKNDGHGFSTGHFSDRSTIPDQSRSGSPALFPGINSQNEESAFLPRFQNDIVPSQGISNSIANTLITTAAWLGPACLRSPATRLLAGIAFFSTAFAATLSYVKNYLFNHRSPTAYRENLIRLGKQLSKISSQGKTALEVVGQVVENCEPTNSDRCLKQLFKTLKETGNWQKIKMAIIDEQEKGVASGVAAFPLTEEMLTDSVKELLSILITAYQFYKDEIIRERLNKIAVFEGLNNTGSGHRRRVIEEILNSQQVPFQRMNFIFPGGNGVNIIVEPVSTRSSDDKVILIGAHIDKITNSDSPVQSEGAYDNASGCLVLLELIEKVRNTPPPDGFNYNFIFFDQEEVGLRGSDAFYENCSSSQACPWLFINIDLVGSKFSDIIASATSASLRHRDPGLNITAPLPAEEIFIAALNNITQMHHIPYRNGAAAFPSDNLSAQMRRYPAVGLAQFAEDDIDNLAMSQESSINEKQLFDEIWECYDELESIGDFTGIEVTASRREEIENNIALLDNALLAGMDERQTLIANSTNYKYIHTSDDKRELIEPSKIRTFSEVVWFALQATITNFKNKRGEINAER